MVILGSYMVRSGFTDGGGLWVMLGKVWMLWSCRTLKGDVVEGKDGDVLGGSMTSFAVLLEIYCMLDDLLHARL